jgi:NADH-quinone oxidoreductase subunit J
MSPLLFWVFVGIMLFFAGMVVLNRSPVASALSLVVSFLALAALYVSIDAYFIGVIQILVYAGAVMVVLLFIIMLLDLKAEVRRKINFPAMCGGLVVILLFLKILSDVCYGVFGGNARFPPIAQGPKGDAWQLGMIIFERYNLALQVVATLILVASIGVEILSKRELK